MAFDDKQESKINALGNGVWKYFDTDGKLLRSNVSESEIMKDYDYILQWREPSNEGYDFDMKQNVIVDMLK